MSAFIVGKNHILFLIAAACSNTIARHGFTWYHNGNHHELRDGDSDRAAEVANMLWLENIKSVGHRYPNESSATLPGTKEKNHVITLADIELFFDRIDPVQVVKACDCYEYQSCEHDGWDESEAQNFIDSLRRRACSALPGYDDAEWGAPEPRAGVVSLYAMSLRSRKQAA